MNSHPIFIDSMNYSNNFHRIKDRLVEKWWYSFDSECILDSKKDNLTIYSFENAKKSI